MSLVVTYTLQPVTITEVEQVTIRPGNISGEIIVTSYFGIKDSLGAVREHGSQAVNLTGAAKTNLISWLNANPIPAFNTQRGL